MGLLGLPLAMVITSIIAMLALTIKLLSQVKLTISKQKLVTAFAMAIILFGLSAYFADMVHTASWIKFVLVSGAAVMGTVILSALVNWSDFRVLIKGYLR